MDGYVAWLKLSREYDPMRGIDRTVAFQRVMNPEPAKTEYVTWCQCKLDTISKLTALKILTGPTVTGDYAGRDGIPRIANSSTITSLTRGSSMRS